MQTLKKRFLSLQIIKKQPQILMLLIDQSMKLLIATTLLITLFELLAHPLLQGQEALSKCVRDDKKVKLFEVL